VKPRDDCDVKVGAFEQSSMDLDGGSVAVGQNNILPETKKSNGHAQNGGKKRKADKISSE
jgi:hypothetical protein